MILSGFSQTAFMGQNEILQQAKELQNELVKYRRFLHAHAEIGFSTQETSAYITERLRAFGYAPLPCARSGVQACAGKGNKTFLLRADIDGLPIKERSGLSFACKNGNMHACGHDLHAAMLLGAAKLLKENEGELCGRVKLLFQPAEEILQGAKAAMEEGVLENPKVDAGMMLHVTTGLELPAGTLVVSSAGVSAPAADYFSIRIQGKGCHGSTPWKGVDALSIAARTALALQELPAREIPFSAPAVLTVGKMQAGVAGNAIADEASLEGTLRVFDEEMRGYIKKRIEQIAKSVAQAFRARAKTEFSGGCPPLVNDAKLSLFTKRESEGLLGKGRVYFSGELRGSQEGGGSEDFAYISHKTPSIMAALCAGERKKGYVYPLHHPKTAFDESVLYMGAAVYAHIAIQWLKEGTGAH